MAKQTPEKVVTPAKTAGRRVQAIPSKAGKPAARSPKPNAKLAKLLEAAPEIQNLDIHVNLAAVTFGDIEMAMGYEQGQEMTMGELLPFLNRVIVGGVSGIPVLALPKIMDAIAASLGALGDLKN